MYESENNCQAVAYNDEEMEVTIFDRPTSMFFIRFGLFHATNKTPTYWWRVKQCSLSSA